MNTAEFLYMTVGNFRFYTLTEFNLHRRYKKVTHTYREVKDGKESDDIIHGRNKNPAVIIYNDNKIYSVQFYVHGILHRESGPAIVYYSNGTISREEWYHDGKPLNADQIKDEKLALDRRKKIMKLIMKIKG